ncbi:MAG: hypothetical protein H7245_19055 [Candidatus Saccharibacteria bacterium]|nr:hypothetical protein [Pseudorhodobacter sp.]
MREFLIALLGLAGAFIVWRHVREALSQPHHIAMGASFAGMRGSTGMAPSAATDLFSWPPLGRFEFDVGVSAQGQAALRALADQNAGSGQILTLSATLHPGRARHGIGAPVEIRVDGLRIGFLADGDATRFQRRLAFEGRAGQVSCCDVKIAEADHPRRADKRSYAIALDLKPFRH